MGECCPSICYVTVTQVADKVLMPQVNILITLINVALINFDGKHDLNNFVSENSEGKILHHLRKFLLKRYRLFLFPK